MNIISLTLYTIEIPMITSFTTGFGTIAKKPTVLVRAQTEDGLVGWGESAALPFPMYNAETVDTCMLVLKNYIAPLVIRKPFQTIEELMNRLSCIKGNEIAKTGLETAVWMITSIQENKSISALLGGTHTKIAVGESIGIKPTIEETLDNITLRLDQGFRRIKVKIKPGWDIQVVESIKNTFGDIPLMVDANSSYSIADIGLVKNLDNYNLMMIEQPLADDDIIDHAVLQKQIRTPICLDESIHSAEDARRAISIGACKIINIKPGRVGGLLESKKIHSLAATHGIGVWCGGMLEIGIGHAVNIAVASLPNCIYPADMSPLSFYYSDDVVINPPNIDTDGYIAVPQAPGLGYAIDEEKIKKYTKQKISVT